MKPQRSKTDKLGVLAFLSLSAICSSAWSQGAVISGGAATASHYVPVQGFVSGSAVQHAKIDKHVIGSPIPQGKTVGFAIGSIGQIGQIGENDNVKLATSGNGQIIVATGVTYTADAPPTKPLLYAITTPLEVGGAPKRVGRAEGGERVRLLGANLLGPSGNVHPAQMTVFFDTKPARIESVTSASEIYVVTPPGYDIYKNPVGVCDVRLVYAGTTPNLVSQYPSAFIYGPYLDSIGVGATTPALTLAYPDPVHAVVFVGCCCSTKTIPGIQGTIRLTIPDNQVLPLHAFDVTFPGSPFSLLQITTALPPPGSICAGPSPQGDCLAPNPTTVVWPPSGTAHCQKFFFQAAVLRIPPIGDGPKMQWSTVREVVLQQ